jgi:hypothetical protein
MVYGLKTKSSIRFRTRMPIAACLGGRRELDRPRLLESSPRNGRYMARRNLGPGSLSGGSYIRKGPYPLHIVLIVPDTLITAGIAPTTLLFCLLCSDNKWSWFEFGCGSVGYVPQYHSFHMSASVCFCPGLHSIQMTPTNYTYTWAYSIERCSPVIRYHSVLSQTPTLRGGGRCRGNLHMLRFTRPWCSNHTLLHEMSNRIAIV